jgi:hypothetical protein
MRKNNFRETFRIHGQMRNRHIILVTIHEKRDNLPELDVKGRTVVNEVIML